VNDPDDTLVWRHGLGNGLPDHAIGNGLPEHGTGSGLPERLWGPEGFSGPEEPPAADLAGGLTSLAFLGASLKRRARVWCTIAALGLVIGSGLYLKLPAIYHASVSVLVKGNPGEDPTAEIQTDAALAQSTAVAGRVVQQLGLHQSVGSFVSTYAVTVVSNQLLTINVGAPSSADALGRASAVATVFLQARAEYLKAQEQQQATILDQQYNQAKRALDSISSQIGQVSAEPRTPAQQAELSNLEAQRGDEAAVAQYDSTTEATTQTVTNAMVLDTEVVNGATLVPKSHLKSMLLYVLGGLIIGLAVGMGIVIISALVSDRLRRRDDVADAIGAPVRLSVGRLPARRWLPLPIPGLPGRTRTQDLDLGRTVEYLRSAVPASGQGPAGLAVIAVDNAKVVARATVALALSYVRQGKQVVVADLSAGAPAARLLGTKRPGVHPVGQAGPNLVVAVPERNDFMPVGPLRGLASAADAAQASDALTAACASADLLLTLASLDPAYGGDYLATWATDAVAMVTAGCSSAVRIHAVGEMVKFAGVRLGSVVLVAADKDDESLGSADLEQRVASGRSRVLGRCQHPSFYPQPRT